LGTRLDPVYGPEELYFTSKRHGPWSDIYGLSATFYRGLTGRDIPEITSRIAHDTLQRPSRLGKNLPLEAESAIMRGLSIRPGLRYREIAELRKILKDSQTQIEAEKARVARDAFTTIVCPSCKHSNEVLKQDLLSGTSTCMNCHVHLKMESVGKAAPVAATDLGKQIFQNKRRRVGPRNAFQMVDCPVCHTENEVLKNDLLTGVNCRGCGIDLTTVIDGKEVDEPDEWTFISPAPNYEFDEVVFDEPLRGLVEAEEVREKSPVVAEPDVQEIEPDVDETGDSGGIPPGQNGHYAHLLPDEDDEDDTLLIDPSDEEEDTLLVQTPQDDEDSTFLIEPEAEEAPRETPPLSPRSPQPAYEEPDEDEDTTFLLEEPEPEVGEEDPTFILESPPADPLSAPVAEDEDEDATFFLESLPADPVSAPVAEDEDEDEDDTFLFENEGPSRVADPFAPPPDPQDVPDFPEPEIAAPAEAEETFIAPPAPEPRQKPAPGKAGEVKRNTITCPKCQTANHFTLEQLFSGVSCRECGFAFTSNAILDDQMPDQAVEIVPTRKRPTLWIAAAATVLLLALAGVSYSFFFTGNSELENRFEQFKTAGDESYRFRNYDLALASYQAARDIHPDDGYIRDQIRKTQEMVIQFNAQEREAREAFISVEAKIFEADSLFDEGRLSQARNLYEVALGDFPEDEYILDQLRLIDESELDQPSNTIAETTAPPEPARIPRPRISLTLEMSLQEAVDQAKPNTIIQLPEGISSLRAPLVIRKPLEIRGAGPNQTLITSQIGPLMLDIQNTRGVKISGVGFEYAGQDPVDLIYINNAQVSFSESSFKGAFGEPGADKGGAAILFAGKSSGTVQNSRFTGNRVAARITDTAQPSFQNNEIFQNEVGIEVLADGRPKISGNRIRDNNGNGVDIRERARPTLNQNKISGNLSNGVYIEGERYNGTLQENEILSNAELGILVTGESQPTLDGNVVKKNGGGGIYFRKFSRGEARNNTVVENKYGGFKVFNQAQPKITANTITGNLGDGIELLNESKSIVDKNEITKNNGDGISILLDKAGGSVLNNKSHGNMGYGISILKEARPTLLGNLTGGNREGDTYEEDKK
ncbi:MAG: right-handed parallel beta-helix repeat-containing protein, partial [Calditrichaeota bacterium]|nr:right-handed parallel beta-helix repeat-containing protein [Calditrichota bacterium]